MLAGIGVLILGSQFHVMVDDKPKESGLMNLATIPQAISKAIAVPTWESSEVRKGEAALLVAIGDMHRRQVGLMERTTERAPHHEIEIWEQNPESAPHVELADLTEDQNRLRTDAAAAVEQLDAFADDIVDSEQLATMRTRFTDLDAALVAAAEALEREAPGDAVRSQEAAVAAFEALLASQKNHYLAAQVGILTIILIIVWQAFGKNRFSWLPAPLFAVVIATFVAAGFSLPVLYVEAPNNLFNDVHYLSLSVLRDAPWVALVQAGPVDRRGR